MRLLDTETGQFRTVLNHFAVPYAILSHTWDSAGEQSYLEVRGIQTSVWKGHADETLIFWLSCLLGLVFTMIVNAISPFLQHVRRLPVLGSWIPQYSYKGPSILFDPRLSEKIRMACAVAREAGHQYLWIDTCCIDKRSSSELSEAINAMYEWYSQSSVCFVFLSDVGRDDDPRAKESEFSRSRWFTRGWTLQELIAPQAVVFLSKDWRYIGTKITLLNALSDITYIPTDILSHRKPLTQYSVAQRFSWASERDTTKEEDAAYCMMGLFGVYMPILYGEGGNAFVRLQEHILMTPPYDQTIFAWMRYITLTEDKRMQPLHLEDLRPSPGRALTTDYMIASGPAEQARFANSKLLCALCPAEFCLCDLTTSLQPEQLSERLGIALPWPTYTPTPFGIRTTLPLIPLDDRPSCELGIGDPFSVHAENWYVAILACENKAASQEDHLLGVLCSLPLGSTSDEDDEMGPALDAPLPVLFGGFQVSTESLPDSDMRRGWRKPSFRCIILSLAEIAAVRSSIRVEEVYISMRPSEMDLAVTHRFKKALAPAFPYRASNIPVSLRIAPWCGSYLRDQGYTVIQSELRYLGREREPYPWCQFTLVSKDGMQLAVSCICRLFPRHLGAMVLVRGPRIAFMDSSMSSPELAWDDFRPVAEAAPIVLSLCGTDLTRRLVQLNLTYSCPGEYLLGIVPLHDRGLPVQLYVSEAAVRFLSTESTERGAYIEEVSD
ncbi:hypothetical protein C8Q78DRAFT_732543 [Trametes maxima]|nr:hypothetical protein C8Q78DRAFT_732543 [Trametes maxima]